MLPMIRSAMARCGEGSAAAAPVDVVCGVVLMPRDGIRCGVVYVHAVDSPTSNSTETGSADSIDLTAALRAEGAALLAAGRRAGIDASVASCGTWSMGDLVWHLTEVYSLFGQVVAGRLLSADDVVRGQRPADSDLLDGCAAALESVAAALDGADDSTPAWSFTADRTVGFIRRRMAVETVVHRWDAQRAAGLDAGIDGPLASAGIDEFLHHFVHRRHRDAEAVGGSVHVHCGDVPGEWTLRPDPSTGEWVTTREHAKGDCALRGTASDLLLALWRRVPLSALDVVGDAGVAARFVASTRL